MEHEILPAGFGRAIEEEFDRARLNYYARAFVEQYVLTAKGRAAATLFDLFLAVWAHELEACRSILTLEVNHD